MSVGRYDKGAWRRVKNTHGTIAPAGGIARIVTGIEVATDCLQITRPDGDDLPNVLIVSEDIPAGGYGIAWESGTHPVLFNGAAPGVDDRIGSSTGQWEAVTSTGGTHVVRAVEGSAAFAFPFSVAADVQRLNIAEYSKVDDSTPDVTTDYKDLDAGQVGNGDFFNSTIIGGGTEQRIVYKWPSMVSGITRVDATLCLGRGLTLSFSGVGPANTPVLLTHIRLRMTYITQNFTAATLTWNILAGLAKGGTAVIADVKAQDLNIPADGTTVLNMFTDIMGASGQGFLPDPNNSYGIELELEANVIPAAFTGYTMSIAAISVQTRTAFLSWI